MKFRVKVFLLLSLAVLLLFLFVCADALDVTISKGTRADFKSKETAGLLSRISKRGAANLTLSTSVEAQQTGVEGRGSRDLFTDLCRCFCEELNEDIFGLCSLACEGITKCGIEVACNQTTRNCTACFECCVLQASNSEEQNACNDGCGFTFDTDSCYGCDKASCNCTKCFDCCLDSHFLDPLNYDLCTKSCERTYRTSCSTFNCSKDTQVCADCLNCCSNNKFTTFIETDSCVDNCSAKYGDDECFDCTKDSQNCAGCSGCCLFSCDKNKNKYVDEDEESCVLECGIRCVNEYDFCPITVCSGLNDCDSCSDCCEDLCDYSEDDEINFDDEIECFELCSLDCVKRFGPDCSPEVCLNVDTCLNCAKCCDITCIDDEDENCGSDCRQRCNSEDQFDSSCISDCDAVEDCEGRSICCRYFFHIGGRPQYCLAPYY